MKNIAIITMNPTAIPNVNGQKTIFTPESKHVQETPDTQVVKIPSYINFGDDVVNIFMHLNTKLPEKPEFQNMLQFVYFSHMVAFYISLQNYDEIIFEDSDLRDKVLLQFKNKERYADRISLVWLKRLTTAVSYFFVIIISTIDIFILFINM